MSAFPQAAIANARRRQGPDADDVFRTHADRLEAAWNTGKRILTWRAMNAFRPGFESDASIIPDDQTPAEHAAEILKMNPSAYDRFAYFENQMGPFAI